MNNKLDDMLRQLFVFSGEQKVLLSFLLCQDDWQTAKEIQAKTALSKAAVNFALNKLFKLKIIEKNQKGKTYLWRIDYYYPIVSIVKHYKILNNIIDIFSLIERLKLLSQKIILFGSNARGEDNQQIDIDLLVITHNDKEVRDIIEKYLSKRKVQIITKTPLSFSELEKKDPVFFRELELGIILWEKKENYGK